MVYHHRGGQVGEEVPQFRQIWGFKVNHNVPAKRGNFSSNRLQIGLGHEIHQAFDKIKAHTAHASVVQGLDFFGGDVHAYCGHATGFAIGGQ